ncbi:MAG: hypothetical protein QOD50_1609 [Actinomycetota bacterium]|nr:hypothetical protein [Actinomycetota bacterium]
MTKPPLTPRQRRGAAIAGIVGFLLATLGWVPFVAVAIGYAFSFGVYFLGAALGGGDTRFDAESQTGTLAANLIGIPATSLGVVVIVALVVGVVLIALGLFLSTVILRVHGVARRAGVTWLGLLLAIVGSWVFDGILGFIAYLVAAAGDVGKGPVAPDGAVTALYFVIAVVIQIALSWLCWWWMAHALRRPLASNDPQPTPAIIPAT